MIDRDKRFIFIQPPKTGTTSIMQWLSNNSCIDLEYSSQYKKHITAELDALTKIDQYYQSQKNSKSELWSLYQDIDRPLMFVLAGMENIGVRIDADVLAEQSSEIASRIEALEKQAYALAGMQFNLASPKQLQHVLYEHMQLPVTEKTPTGSIG